MKNLKVWLLVVVLVMTTASFVGCSGDKKDDTPAESTETEQTTDDQADSDSSDSEKDDDDDEDLNEMFAEDMDEDLLEFAKICDKAYYGEVEEDGTEIYWALSSEVGYGAFYLSNEGEVISVLGPVENKDGQVTVTDDESGYSINFTMEEIEVEGDKGFKVNFDGTEIVIMPMPVNMVVSSMGELQASIEEQEKAQQEQEAKDKADQEQAEKDKAAKDKADKEKAEKDKAAKDKAAKDKAAKDKAAKDKAAKDQAAKEKAAQEKAAQEQAAREKAEQEQQQKQAEENEDVEDAIDTFAAHCDEAYYGTMNGGKVYWALNSQDGFGLFLLVGGGETLSYLGPATINDNGSITINDSDTGSISFNVEETDAGRKLIFRGAEAIINPAPVDLVIRAMTSHMR